MASFLFYSARLEALIVSLFQLVDAPQKHLQRDEAACDESLQICRDL